MSKKSKFPICVALFESLLIYLCILAATEAGQPVVSRLTITDVSPLNFSVVFIVSEPSDYVYVLHVFDQNMGELTNVSVVRESINHSPAENLGIIKFKVNSLMPNTVYYFQVVITSIATSDVTVYPEDPMMVLTETSTEQVGNDGFVQDIYYRDGSNADGSLLILAVEGGNYPITGWVGGQENPQSPWALIDANHFYSTLDHKTLLLVGGEALTGDVFGGIKGYAHFTGEVPTTAPGPNFVSIGPSIYLDVAPVAVINGPTAGVAGFPLFFIGDGSYDLDGDLLGYLWDFGNGDSSTQENPSYTYADPGSYTIILTVDDGIFTDSNATVVEIFDVLKGDIDFDNQLTLSDAILGLQILNGESLQNVGDGGSVGLSLRVSHSDLNDDLKIGMPEIIYVLQKVAQLR